MLHQAYMLHLENLILKKLNYFNVFECNFIDNNQIHLNISGVKNQIFRNHFSGYTNLVKLNKLLRSHLRLQ